MVNDNIFLTKHTLKYNMIFSDEEWKAFHQMVLKKTGKNMDLPELLALFNQLPEYAQEAAKGFGVESVVPYLNSLDLANVGVDAGVSRNSNVVIFEKKSDSPK